MGLVRRELSPVRVPLLRGLPRLARPQREPLPTRLLEVVLFQVVRASVELHPARLHPVEPHPGRSHPMGLPPVAWRLRAVTEPRRRALPAALANVLAMPTEAASACLALESVNAATVTVGRPELRKFRKAALPRWRAVLTELTRRTAMAAMRAKGSECSVTAIACGRKWTSTARTTSTTICSVGLGRALKRLAIGHAKERTIANVATAIAVAVAAGT